MDETGPTRDRLDMELMLVLCRPGSRLSQEPSASVGLTRSVSVRVPERKARLAD